VRVLHTTGGVQYWVGAGGAGGPGGGPGGRGWRGIAIGSTAMSTPGGAGLPGQASPLVPVLERGRHWLPEQPAHRVGGLHGDAEPAELGPAPARQPELGTPVLGWVLGRSSGDENAAPANAAALPAPPSGRSATVLVCAADLQVHVAPVLDSDPNVRVQAEEWLRGLGRYHASDNGPAVTSLATLVRASPFLRGATRYVPADQRLALLLGLTTLEGDFGPAAGPAAGLHDTCGEALRAACCVQTCSTHGGPAGVHLELLVHADTPPGAHVPEVDWRGTSTPDYVCSPLGTRGACSRRLLGARVAVLFQQSTRGTPAQTQKRKKDTTRGKEQKGKLKFSSTKVASRGTPDAEESAVQHLVAGAILAVARSARRTEWAAAGRNPPRGLLAPVLVVGLPDDWDGAPWPGSQRGVPATCRAWLLEVCAGLIRVRRSRGLTVRQATTLVGQHVGRAA
jgi:hypothetical protein